MRYNGHRHAFVSQLLHNIENLINHFRVKSTRRLVKQQSLRLHAQRTRNRYTLLLTTAELVRIVVGLLFHANLFQIHMRSSFCFLLRHAAHLHRCQHQVLQNSHMREKIEALEYHADFLTDFVDISLAVQRNTVDNDTAAGRLL